MQRSSAVSSQQGTPTLPSAFIPSKWSPVSRCLVWATSFPEGIGQTLLSPAATVQPQRKKANVHPVWTPDFRQSEVLYPGLSWRQTGKMFWNSSKCFGENAGNDPCCLSFPEGKNSLSTVLLPAPLWNFQISKFTLLFSLDASSGVADHCYLLFYQEEQEFPARCLILTKGD